jgi:POT family proton-dependent oligopeptide transporter
MYSTEKSGSIYGFYTGFVYLTPLLGGYIADKYFGQRRCITLGAILMCIGLFTLSFGKESLFLLALFIMVIANGFFKSNISSVLGLLYGKDSDKKDSAFTIFYMGINLGALFSPLVCGTIAVKYGFNWGFASAGTGMLVGLFTYKLFENKLLGNCGLEPVKKCFNEDKTKQIKVTKREKLRLYALFILMLFTVVFWTCYEQAGCSLTLFAEYSTNRNILGYLVPTGYFQALNPLYIIILAPLMSELWTVLRRKNIEPTSVEKFTIALVLMSVAYVVMALAGRLSEFGLVSAWWLVVVYLIMTFAELCISPIGLSLVSKLAPRQFMSVLMGSWFLTSFFGNILAGLWGGKYGSISSDILFLTLSVVSLISGVILACMLPYLKRFLGKY